MSDIGIDLGTDKTVVSVKKQGVVFNEPSVLAYNTKTKKVVAVGTQADKMVGKTPEHIKIIRPILNGVVNDYDFAKKMLTDILRKVSPYHKASTKFLKPRIAVGISSIVTDIEKNAVIDLVVSLGARKVFVVDSPMALALGANLSICKPKGRLVLDIGGGCCDIALISLGGIVVKDSMKIAGNSFDDVVVKTVKNKYSLEIGPKTATALKCKIGLVSSSFNQDYFLNKKNNKNILDDNYFEIVKGKDVMTGMPISQKVCSLDFLNEFNLVVKEIIDLIKKMISQVPPDLLSDIQNSCVLLGGGGANLKGLRDEIEKQLKVKVFLPENSSELVAIGLSRIFDFATQIDSGLIQKSSYVK